MSGKNENTNLKRDVHPNVHSSTVYNSQDVEAIQVLMDGYRRHTHTHTRISLSHKKEQNSATGNNADGPREYYAWSNKSDNDKHCVSFICEI